MRVRGSFLLYCLVLHLTVASGTIDVAKMKVKVACTSASLRHVTFTAASQELRAMLAERGASSPFPTLASAESFG